MLKIIYFIKQHIRYIIYLSVSHKYIITAAHCTRIQPSPNNLLAYVGRHNLNDGNFLLNIIFYKIY